MLCTFEVHVEGRQFDNADAAGDSIFADFFDGGLRGLFFEFDFVAFEGDFAHAFGGVGGVNQEAHEGAFFAPDKVNDFIKPPAGHIHKLTVMPLGDADDFVFDAEFAAFVGGAARHKFADGYAVFFQ